MPPSAPSPLPAAFVRTARNHSVRLLAFTSPALAVMLLAGGGCASPLHPDTEPELRHSILASIRHDTQGSLAPPASGTPRPATEPSPPRIDSLGLAPDILTKLEQNSGPKSYADFTAPLGQTLAGEPQQVASISLKRAVLTTASNNLTLQYARLVPAVAQTDTERALAVFDLTLFASTQYQTQDNLAQRTGFGLTPLVTVENTTNFTAGVRRKLESGGTFTLQSQLSRLNNSSPGTFPLPNPAIQPAITVQLDQPLLRNFGSDANLSDVRQAANKERDAIQQLKATMLQQVADAETAYWTLVRASGELKIAQRLLDRGEDVRTTLKNRQEKAKDVRASQFSDAVATVEARRADVIRARNTVREASDRLKQIMNDPDLNVGSEVLLQPVDDPMGEPMTLSLQDVVTTALGNRPEIQRALLAISDSAIRQQLADNGRLPALDLRLQMRISELSNSASDAYNRLTDTNFIDYLVGVNYEQPIGNRGPEANYAGRVKESVQAQVTYRDVVQRVLVDVKSGLRSVVTSYQLIEQTRAGRIAAAENLRTIEVEERTIQSLTPEFLNLKLDRQQRLAAAEAGELQAVTDYNASIGRLYASMGTALERNNIAFNVPKATDPLPGDRKD